MKQVLLFLLSIACVLYSIYVYQNIPAEYYDSFSNKFAFTAGPISKLECGQRCSERYTKCMSYGAENTNWCNRLYDECSNDCKWNELW